jgi:hypothetical protein
MKNFEKYIKVEASAFQLDPAPDSFKKIMQALEKKKKRRFIFWLWFVLPGLALGSAFLFIGLFYPVIQPTSTYASLVIPNNSSTVFINQQKSTFLKTSGSNPIILAPTNQVNLVKKKNQDMVTVNKKELIPDTRSETQHNAQSLQNVIIPLQKESIVRSKTQNDQIETLKTRENSNMLIGTNNQFNLLNTRTNIVPYTKNIIRIPHIIPHIEKPGFSKWSLGMYSEVGVCKSIFINNKDSAGAGYTANRTAEDKFLLSYSAGIQFRYSPVKFLAIESGIGFTRYQSNQFISDAGITSSSLWGGSSPDTVYTVYSSAPTSQEYHNIYDYISIPLKLYYQKKWKWTGVEAGGGVIFDIPVNTNSYAANENTSISYLRKEVKDSRLNMFGIQTSANIHMVFHVKKFSFFVGPVFKYRLNSQFDNNYIVQQHSYFLGAEIGIRYNF